MNWVYFDEAVQNSKTREFKISFLFKNRECHILDLLHWPFKIWITKKEGISLRNVGFWIKKDSLNYLTFLNFGLPHQNVYKYPSLSQKSLKILLPVSSTYLCETGFSVMTVLKSKQRNRLNFSIDACMRLLALLHSIQLRLDLLAKRVQEQKFH